jgi:hypothetical protein
MEDNDIIAIFVPLMAAVVFVTWSFFVIWYIVLSYKHDLYIEKNFPELTEMESLSIFGRNRNLVNVCMNIFSSNKAAPDEYVSIIRKKIRYSLLGAFSSMTVLPFGLFIFLVLILALRYWLT